MTNPGPASTLTPNSEPATIVESGTTVAYTFATLPNAANFAPGFLALTSDQGMCYVTTSGVWAVLGVPQSGGALQRQINNLAGMTNLTSFAQGSVSIQYWDQQWPVTATRADLLVSWAAASSATTNTGAIVISAYAAIYTNNTGSSALSSVSSGSTQTTYTYASNTAGVASLSAAAIRPISVPMNVSMTPGEYYIAFNFSTNSSSIGLSTTNLAQSISVMGFANVQSALNYAEFTANTTSNSNLFVQGIWSSAGTGLPGSIPYTQIAQTGANLSAAQFAWVLRNY
jgi:hypothetical protein